jgi:hypothetical protein
MTCLVDTTGKGFAIHDQLHKVKVDALVIRFCF